MGRDAYYPSYSGTATNVVLFLCNGAFNPDFPVTPPKPKEEPPIYIPPERNETKPIPPTNETKNET